MFVKIYTGSMPRLCVILGGNEHTSTISYVERKACTEIAFKLSTPMKVDNSKLLDIGELDRIIRITTDVHAMKIDSLKQSLITTFDFTDEFERDILSLKKRIQTVARRLSEADLENEDESFKNLLYEIGQLKKQLGSYKNEYKDDARKKNGAIKYNIKQAEREMKYELGVLDLNVMNELLGWESEKND